MLELRGDLRNLIVRVIDTEKHHLANKKDQSGKRGLQLTESKIRRLVKYYKRVGKLSDEWIYSRKQAKFLIK